MRKIFIDLGAGSGDDIKGYYDLDPDNINHEIFAFEANPHRVKLLEKRYPNVTVHNAAAGIEDGYTTFYLSRNLDSSSLKENKSGVNKNTTIDIKVMDIAAWVKENFKPTDHITMVMDIEGGEYDVLERMWSIDVWHWINEFYVEFHGEKLEGFDLNIENNLVDRLIEFYDDKVYIFRKHQHEKFLRLNLEGI